MKALRVGLAIVIALVAARTLVAAESKAVQDMAGILTKLNHFATDPEKETLKKIVADKAATPYEQTIAQALVNVLHTVAAADKPKLEAITKDKDAPESIKTLASVILSLNHTPTDADKAKLKKLMAS